MVRVVFDDWRFRVWLGNVEIEILLVFDYYDWLMDKLKIVIKIVLFFFVI